MIFTALLDAMFDTYSSARRGGGVQKWPRNCARKQIVKLYFRILTNVTKNWTSTLPFLVTVFTL